MTLNELSKELEAMYENAPKGEQVTNIYLFGIKYHNLIKDFGIKDIIQQAGLHKSYSTELAKAVKLGKYVVLK